MSEYGEDSFEGDSSSTSSSSSDSHGSDAALRGETTSATVPALLQTMQPLPVHTPVSSAPPAFAIPTPTPASDTVPPVVSEALASGRWKVLKDAATGKDYYYNAETRKTTWDLATELADHAARISVSTSSAAQAAGRSSGVIGSDLLSTSHVDSLDERKRAAIEAGDRSEFQYLSSYVAFGSNAPSVGRSSGQSSHPASQFASLTRSESQFSPLRVTGSVAALAAPNAQSFDEHKGRPMEQPQRLVASEQEEGRAESKQSSVVAASQPPSSSTALSTLSQHFAPLLSAADTALPHSPNGMRGEAREKSSEEISFSSVAVPRMTRRAPVIPSLPDCLPAAQSLELQVNLPALDPPEAAAFKSPLHEPLLTQLNAAPSADLVGTSAMPATLWGQPAVRTEKTEEAAARPVTNSTPTTNTGRGDEASRVVELRETSEAVERLVKAFATLRGHAPPPAPLYSRDTVTSAAPVAAASAETQRATALHVAGAANTVMLSRTQRPRSLTPASRTKAAQAPSSGIPGGAAVMQAANEAVLEEMLLSYVVEMTSQKMGSAARGRYLVEQLKRRPQHEIIPAQNFKAPNGGSSAGPGGTHAKDRSGGAYSVFDGEMRAFASGDEDASTALYFSVQDALEKYVLRHVASCGGGSESITEARVQERVTAQFAWTLLLDLLALCQDIAQTHLSHNRSKGTSIHNPVLVRYDGDSTYAQIARSAIHCLPFEVLASSHSSSSSHGGTVFRLEYWVTLVHMWVAMSAVTDTLRRHIVTQSRQLQYSPFGLSGIADVDASVNSHTIVPPGVPLFSLVRDRTFSAVDQDAASSGAMLLPHTAPQQPPAHSQAEYGRKASRGGEKGDDEKYRDSDVDNERFNVSAKGLSSIAYAISCLSTNIMTVSSRDSEIVREERDYSDLTECVADTICELVQDPAVCAAVERRAAAAFERTKTERRANAGNRDWRVREREIIAKAEAEAERVVQKIMQEMRVHKETA